jgi:hypothetical protein
MVNHASRHGKTPPSNERPPEEAQLRTEIARLLHVLKENADERISLQVLIDLMPDYLYV